MCRRDIDHVLMELRTRRDPAEMRRLLQQANACRSCPEQDLQGRTMDECSCLLRFRTEPQNSVNNILRDKESLADRTKTQ